MRQILNYHDAVLYDTDLDLFRGSNWLNDNCINFYLKYLQFEKIENDAAVLFVDPTVVSCMRLQCDDEDELRQVTRGLLLSEACLILMPINDNESFDSTSTHWSLLVFDATRQQYLHYDSSSNHNEAAARTTAELFNQLLRAPTSDVQNMTCPQQPNSYDCGIYALLVADWLATKQHTAGSIAELTDAELAHWLTPATVAEARQEMYTLAKQASEAFLSSAA